MKSKKFAIIDGKVYQMEEVLPEKTPIKELKKHVRLVRALKREGVKYLEELIWEKDPLQIPNVGRRGKNIINNFLAEKYGRELLQIFKALDLEL